MANSLQNFNETETFITIRQLVLEDTHDLKISATALTETLADAAEEIDELCLFFRPTQSQYVILKHKARYIRETINLIVRCKGYIIAGLTEMARREMVQINARLERVDPRVVIPLADDVSGHSNVCIECQDANDRDQRLWDEFIVRYSTE